MHFRGDDVLRVLRRRREPLAVAVLLLVALALRVYQVDWDQGHLYHPDERFILMSAAAISLSWPPSLAQLVGPAATLIPKDYSYSYGTFALYLVRIVAALLLEIGHLVPPLHAFDNLNDLGNLRLVGRPISAVFDTFSVYLIWRLGRQLYGRIVGLLGAGLVAFSVLDVQLAHFYATDTLLTSLCVAAVVASVEYVRRGRASSALLAGVFAGLALATKASAAVVLAPVFAAHLVRWIAVQSPDGRLQMRWPDSKKLADGIELLLASVVALALVFLIAEPYALIDTQHYLQGIYDQSAMVRGAVDLPYTRQYAGRPAYLYFLQNLALFGVGLPLGLAMIGGWIYAIIRNVRRPRVGELIVLVYVVPYFAITGDFWAKFLRYMLPIAPFLAMFAALGLVKLLGWARRVDWSFLRNPWPARAAATALVVVVGFSAFYSLAFDHMYDRASPPVVGSAWLYQHAPQGSVIATEHWEEGMPQAVQTANGMDTPEAHGFRDVTMPMYDDDNAAKLETVVSNLEQANYVVFFSNRLYGTVTRLPNRYPMSRRYYEDLFGGKLGFQLVEVAEREPNLLGVAFVDDTLGDPGLPVPPLLQQMRLAPITINLGHADESFSVYDHQKVLIFEKTQQLTPDQLRALLGPPATSEQLAAANASPQTTTTYKSLTLTPAQQAVVRAGGTFRDLFNRDDLFNQVPLLAWIAMIALIGLAGLPLSFLALRFLPDRGYLVAKTLGVLVLVWLTWMSVSLGLVQATRLATLGFFVLFLAIGVVAWWLQQDQIRAFVRSNLRLLAIEEGLFWIAFLYDVWIRSLDPDLWHPVLGGEKPMDLAYLNAAIRSPIYPPYDPWFGGGYLNYYYLGQIVVGTLTKISGVLPTTSFNLVIPFLFALTVGGCFTAALALIHRGAGPPRRPAILGGVLAALMVCVLGNLGGFVQLVGNVEQQASVPPTTSGPDLADFGAFAGGALNVLFGGHALAIPQDWYWGSTRMLALLGLQGSGSINEFPYFTFLFADLHAHLINLPFTLLAIAFCVNIVKSGGWLAQLPEARLPSRELGFAVPTALPRTGPLAPVPVVEEVQPQINASTIAAIGFAGLVAGALYPINSWDYPTYLALIGLAMLVPWYLSAGRSVGGLVTVVLRFAVIVVLSQVLYRPFYANFQSFYSGVHPNDEQSSVLWYVMIHGLFLVVMLSYFAIEGWTLYRRMAVTRTLRLWLVHWETLPRALALQQALVRSWDPREQLALYGVAALVAFVGITLLAGMPLFGLLVALVVLALAIGLRRDRAPEDCFLVFLFATGLAIGAGVELVTIDGDVGRMNTVFKFYEQVWVLFGIAGAVALVRMKDRLLGIRNELVRGAWIVVIVAFFAMGAVYPVFGTISRVSNRFDPTIPPTLDGMAYMDHAVYNDDGHNLNLASDKAAILWLMSNVNGTPTILEGTRPLYRWGSRISIYTGLPTVIGWDWHQKQQRWGYQDQVDQRTADVQRMYNDPSPTATLALLRQYQVKYVILGQLEQAFYPGAAGKFDAMVGSSLDVVYNLDGVKIYQVK